MITGTTRLAVRNLGRNLRRTFLSVLGIGIGCAIALTVVGVRHSVVETYSRVAAEAGPGHFRVSPQGWLPQRDEKLRLLDGVATLARLRATPHVKVAAPRSRAQALLAMGTRVAGVDLTGVDWAAEPAANRFVRRLAQGRYLAPDDREAIVIGKSLAERLSVEADDDLVVTLVGSGGEMQSAMLRIVGVSTSGSREIDSGIAHVPLATLEALSGTRGIGEIAVLLDDFDRIEASHPTIRAAAGPNAALLWREVSEELATHLKQDEAMSRLVSGIIVFVVILGVASAQLTAVLERRREFAVFAAVGMRPRRLVLQIFFEALVLGLLGALAGALLAAPGLSYLIVEGIDVSSVFSSEMTVEGVFIDPIIRAQFGWWMVPFVVLLSLAASLLGAVYPAIYAARTDPAAALRSAA